MLISLIVPCYNEEEAMPLFYQEACRVAKNMKESHELLENAGTAGMIPDFAGDNLDFCTICRF